MLLLDPLVHHFGEGRPAFGVQARFAGVFKLLDDLHTILLGPFLHLLPLDGNGVLLAILGRMAIVGYGLRLDHGRSGVDLPPI